MWLIALMQLASPALDAIEDWRYGPPAFNVGQLVILDNYATSDHEIFEAIFLKYPGSEVRNWRIVASEIALVALHLRNIGSWDGHWPRMLVKDNWPSVFQDVRIEFHQNATRSK